MKRKVNKENIVSLLTIITLAICLLIAYIDATSEVKTLALLFVLATVLVVVKTCGGFNEMDK